MPDVIAVHVRGYVCTQVHLLMVEFLPENSTQLSVLQREIWHPGNLEVDMITCARVLVDAQDSRFKSQVIIQVVVVSAVQALNLLEVLVIDLATQSA